MILNLIIPLIEVIKSKKEPEIKSKIKIKIIKEIIVANSLIEIKNNDFE